MVKTAHYWNRCDGCDHFIVIPQDWGRCAFLVFPQTVGRLFVIQYNGESTTLADCAKLEDGGCATTATVASFPSPQVCYTPRDPATHLGDVLVPVFSRQCSTPANIGSIRDTSALYSFGEGGRPGHVPYFGRLVRAELLAAHRVDPIPHAKVVRDVRADDMLHYTQMLMARAVFCMSPPGVTAWTSRFYAALVQGCIPVTFYRENTLPWEEDGLNCASVTKCGHQNQV